MADYKLTLLDNYDVKQGVGFALYARFEIIKVGETVPSYVSEKRFAYRFGTEDSVIQQDIEAWFNGMVEVHSAQIEQTNAQARLQALQQALNRTETV